MALERPEIVDGPEDEPGVEAFRALLCAHLATLAPRLAERVRVATESCESYRDVICLASHVVADEGDGDLDDFVDLDRLLRSFGVEPIEGSERGVDLESSSPSSTEEIVAGIREGIFRRQLHVGCEGLMAEDQRDLLLDTHPTEEPVE